MSPMVEQLEPDLQRPTIVLAGATGKLGLRIAHHLRERGADVRALVRSGNTGSEVTSLRELGAQVMEVDYTSVAELTKACAGAVCVVSALSGLREVLVIAQAKLLQAAVEAGVPRFIPSDFSIDYTKLPYGNNRNLDLRREFGQVLDQAPITATSVLNGMFTDLLTGQAPVILFGLGRVAYWGDADQPLDFTTLEDTAAFTAAAALDPTTPRYLRVAGEVTTIRGLQATASEVTGKPFRLFRVGGLPAFNRLISVVRSFSPQSSEVFPPWQGMQYLRDMFSGLSKLEPLDTARYPDLQWTSVRQVLATRTDS